MWRNDGILFDSDDIIYKIYLWNVSIYIGIINVPTTRLEDIQDYNTADGKHTIDGLPWHLKSYEYDDGVEFCNYVWQNEHNSKFI